MASEVYEIPKLHINIWSVACESMYFSGIWEYFLSVGKRHMTPQTLRIIIFNAIYHPGVWNQKYLGSYSGYPTVSINIGTHKPFPSLQKLRVIPKRYEWVYFLKKSRYIN